jgi:ABC-2 type transport system ATP-binding protein
VNVLQAQELTRRFDGTCALRALDLALGAGEIYGLVGCDGAGKTTAMRIFAGLMAPDSGEVKVLGEDPMSSSAPLRSAIGYMPQHESLYGDLSVEENLRFFARLFCLSRADYRERRARLLGITRLEPFADRRADALSGGMYKKLALSCCLLSRPRVLLLDEPTNGVDPVSRRELWALLFELVAEGMAILVSTAYMDEAARCHRVGLIHEGKLLLEGRPTSLLEGFPHQVLEVVGGDRVFCEQILADHPAVVASVGAGPRLRAVVKRDAEEPLLRRLAQEAGAATRQLRPVFEDLFLAATARGREGRSPAASRSGATKDAGRIL